MYGWMAGIFCTLLWKEKRAALRAHRVAVPENSIHVASNMQAHGFFLPQLSKTLHTPVGYFNVE